MAKIGQIREGEAQGGVSSSVVIITRLQSALARTLPRVDGAQRRAMVSGLGGKPGDKLYLAPGDRVKIW